MFRAAGGWILKHFFDDSEIFRKLADHCNNDLYRFEFKTVSERNKALKLLELRSFDVELVEDLGIWPPARARLQECPTVSIFCLGMAEPTISKPGGAPRTRHTCRPRPTRSSSSRADGRYPGPSGRHQAREKASWQRRAVGDEEESSKELTEPEQEHQFQLSSSWQLVGWRNGKGFCEKILVGEAYMSEVPVI